MSRVAPGHPGFRPPGQDDHPRNGFTSIFLLLPVGKYAIIKTARVPGRDPGELSQGGIQMSQAAWTAWLSALLGLWFIVSPWVFNFSQNVGAMWNSIIVGIVVAVLSAYAGSQMSKRGS
ncbi:MAG TPA: SPW repeat protein [Alicyclobacillus sp.]|nr:SPW repeat protein [Alicyclobacillus sp.]